MKGLIDKHYQNYLEKVQLKETDMEEVQKIETKRAFVAGMSELFVAMTTGLGLGITLLDYKTELEGFWKKEVENFNKKQDYDNNRH